ncbi:hypothetical protein FDP41_013488 [Naegleria fowleri]|uniref:BTB domain-containing protein n=1 Tax=Naegleria fowleri TaxID=5763 RepID=A0A6A5C114_NAEFO|nr:uncharacterized protein FDP41_013488 [Naegleria fowleri]KAF0980274.1 hypothetical protein FDP41_013488 [Naegleria fowleri]CAG4715339.1 unnamed protein product [Naegleria fowleri]
MAQIAFSRTTQTEKEVLDDVIVPECKTEESFDHSYNFENKIHLVSKDLFSQGFSKYFRSDLFSDVTVNHVPTKTTYRCHRIILAHQSQFFESLFTGPFKDSGDCVDVHFEDMDGVFEKVLEYLYTGNITIPATSIVGLHVAADQLICNDLSNSVMVFLDQFLSEKNVFQILNSSLRQYDDAILEKACTYIAMHFVSLYDEFNLIYSDLPSQVFFGIIAHENIAKGSGTKAVKSKLISQCVDDYCKKNNVLENVELLQLCIDALSASETITPDSAAFYLIQCQKHDLKEHISACTRILALNFNDLKDLSIIYQFKPETFYELISSDELYIGREDNAFEVILSYFKHREDVTEDQRQKIANTIRFPFLSYSYLQKIVEKTEPLIASVVLEENLALSLLERIKKLEKKGSYKVNDEEEGPLFLKPRTTRMFTHTFDFDECGIIYWLGTLYLSENYVAPTTRGLLKISCSCSFEAGSEDDIISRNPVSCNLVNNPGTTITFDFLQLIISPSAYTIRHTSARDTECLRNWKFQGSIDGNHFVDIKVHTNDQTITTKSQSATFSVECNEYFRYFRILQDGLNSSSNNYLSLGGFEIYGLVKSIA